MDGIKDLDPRHESDEIRGGAAPKEPAPSGPVPIPYPNTGGTK